jgi:hypothetical protein
MADPIARPRRPAHPGIPDRGRTWVWKSGEVAARTPRILSAGCLAFVALSALLLVPPARPADAATSAATLYREAMATTEGWRVHYSSSSNASHTTFTESGDAGPASGTQALLGGQGTSLDRATLIVIGDLTFVKGNEVAMEDLTGLSPAEAATTMGQWVVFSSNNPAYAQVVVGVRSHDVAQEVALNGPYTLGPSRQLHGSPVDAVRGTLQLQGEKKTGAVLYVRASGPHVLVEEDTVDAHGTPNGAEHIVFSRWGESVRPQAPDATFTLGSVSTA